jgi:protein-arginine kinase activator protein McsA
MLRTCFNVECQKLFSTSGLTTLCPKCQKKEDEAFEIIKEFLSQRPGAAIVEIHEATEVPMDVIDNLYKSGRLNMVVLPKCNRCGDTIKDNSGLSVCQPCAKAMQQQFASAMSEIRPAAPPTQSAARPRNRNDDGKSYGLGTSR